MSRSLSVRFGAGETLAENGDVAGFGPFQTLDLCYFSRMPQSPPGPNRLGKAVQSALVIAAFFAIAISGAGLREPAAFPSPQSPANLLLIGGLAMLVGGASGFAIWCFDRQSKGANGVDGGEMFGWFSNSPKKSQQPSSDSRLMPEAKWAVECDNEVLRVTDDKGSVKQLQKGDLTGVIIETNDSGPWGADVWWLFFGPDDRVAIAYPQGATGEQAMLDYVCSLPRFDHAKMTEAMRSTDNAVFPVWRRAASGE